MNKRFSMLLVMTLVLSGCSDTPPDEQQREEEAQQEGGTAVSVRVEPAEVVALQGWVYSQGTARAAQREFLTFTGPGRVTYLDESLRIGSPVKAGQVIAHQAPERVEADRDAARAALSEADANLALAKVTLQRYETLIEQRSASQQELDQAAVQLEQAEAARNNARAQLAQAQLGVEESRLVSPIDGVLARLNVERGRYFTPEVVQTSSEQNALRTVPALVIDPSRFEIRVDLPAYYFRELEEGARAVVGGTPPRNGHDIDPDTLENQVPGTVHAISPSLDPETRTFEVIVHTRDDSPPLQDGEFVALWIAQPSKEDVLSVPLDALRYRSDQAFVFVYDENRGVVSERRVTLGQQADNRRAVLDGLNEGEQVVTEGRARLADGQRVRVLGDSKGAQ